MAIANLFSKQIATISGVGFTLMLFIVFTISERLNAKARQRNEARASNSSISMFGPKSPSEADSRAARMHSGRGPRLQPDGASAKRAAERQISAGTTSS